MGAPKQKWTSGEEAALKAGIAKYGVGKWSTILKDPEFSTVLRSRSNVDLKDKWRNLNCMANGLGSRHRAKVSYKSNQVTPKIDKDAIVPSSTAENDSEVLDVIPFSSSSETPTDDGSQTRISRLDDLILEAITKLKEPRGSSRHAIAQYIEELHSLPQDFERMVATNLKLLTDNGLLIKVKHLYRIAPNSMSSDAGKVASMFLPDGTKNNPTKVEKNVIRILTKAQVDAELEQMKNMTAQEAAAAAAQAVAEAEAAIAEAEVAAREAEEAEAEAEAAQCFAEAATKALKCNTIRCW
ncbi:single myb histone 5-like isoform X2 [Olea europaea var. sylvestris]|uniref:single myb histone 5-like isoform X2 n=2 Tax=Olea europaea var. sylvestris TaxID=158386 RepID=UPI000C1D8D44|nr:single myb histone 5-like isoform X2 [Olea europaea var. sylvestris]